MKCIRYLDNGKVVRVTDQQAFAMVQGGAAIYVPKSEWKKQRREFKETAERIEGKQ
jgi:hypothetical protein